MPPDGLPKRISSLTDDDVKASTSAFHVVLIQDPAIPGLVSMQEGGLNGLFADFGLPTPVEDLRLIRYHRGSRGAFFARADHEQFVVKAYAKDRSPLVAVLQALRQHDSAGREAPTTARLLAFDLGRRILVWERLRGATCLALIRAGHGEAAGRLAGRWVNSALEIPIEFGRPYSPDWFLRKAGRYVRVMKTADPIIAEAASLRLDQMNERPPNVSRLGLRHGSLSVHHVVELASGPTTIDWDAFGQGPVELDVANFLMTLRRTAQLQADLTDRVSRARQAFLDELSDVTDPYCLAWYETAMLLKLAKYYCHRRPPNWRSAAVEALATAALDPRRI